MFNITNILFVAMFAQTIFILAYTILTMAVPLMYVLFEGNSDFFVIGDLLTNESIGEEYIYDTLNLFAESSNQHPR